MEPNDDVFATVLDVAVVQYDSVSEKTDLLATPSIREWKEDHATELQEHVKALRATSS